MLKILNTWWWTHDTVGNFKVRGVQIVQRLEDAIPPLSRDRWRDAAVFEVVGTDFAVLIKCLDFFIYLCGLPSCASRTGYIVVYI